MCTSNYYNALELLLPTAVCNMHSFMFTPQYEEYSLRTLAVLDAVQKNTSPLHVSDENNTVTTLWNGLVSPIGAQDGKGGRQHTTATHVVGVPGSCPRNPGFCSRGGISRLGRGVGGEQEGITPNFPHWREGRVLASSKRHLCSYIIQLLGTCTAVVLGSCRYGCTYSTQAVGVRNTMS